MKTSEFFAILEAIPAGKQWVNQYGMLRYQRKGSRRDYCPVTLACWKHLTKLYDNSQYQIAGKELGLPSRTATAIADAADASVGMTPTRKKLLDLWTRKGQGSQSSKGAK